MKPTNITSEDLPELKQVGYTDVEIRKLDEFLQTFCRTARLYLVRIFIRGKARKKEFREIMDVLLFLWQDVWVHGNADRIGDPDDVGTFEDGRQTHGWNNVCAFFQAYKNLGLPSPKFLF